MKNSIWGLAAVFIVELCSCPATADSQPTTWRQRLTVIVSAPNGEMTGSAVTEVRVEDERNTLRLPEMSGLETSFSGEAVAVEVLPKRYLFVLLTGESDSADAGHWAFPTFGLNPDGHVDLSDTLAALGKLPLHKPFVLPSDAYPTMVDFGDIADPLSVQAVAPGDLGRIYGSGFRLKSITLELTNDPITTGNIETILTWLPKVAPNKLDGRTYEIIEAENRLANALGTGSFSTEIGK